MKRYKIYNCLSKKDNNKEVKVIVPNWINIENYKDNKDLEFVTENKRTVKTLQSIDGIFLISLTDSKSYNYLSLRLNKNDKSKISIESFIERKEEDVVKILKDRYQITIIDNNKIPEIISNLNNYNNLKKPKYTSKKIDEYELISNVLNYYLSNLGLELLIKKVNPKELQNIAKFGDSLFDVHLLDVFKSQKIPIDSLRDFMRSNSNMKNTLIKKGFYELSSSNIDSHFCGSLFEILYWISYKQKNYNVLNSLFNEATGLKLEQEELFYI